MKNSPTLRALLVAIPLFASLSIAQTTETIPFRAILSPANEIPPIAGLAASGAGTLWVHTIRDAAGQLTSASLEFQVNYKFATPVNITAMHIHNGSSTVNASVVFDSSLVRIDGASQGWVPFSQRQFLASDAAGLALLQSMLDDPSGFYLNMHTTDNPGGAMRGQVQRAEMAVRPALLSAANEVPPIADSNASAKGTILAVRTVDSAGNTTSGHVVFDMSYQGFPSDTVISAMHLHLGEAGVNGPVTIDSGIAAGTAVPASGAGFQRFNAEVDVTRAGAAQTLDNVFYNPGGVYWNMHTKVSPGGAIRGQLLPVDKTRISLTMAPANELPPIAGLDASGPGSVTVYASRNPDGSILAGAVFFDVNVRVASTPAPTFTLMHIHKGDASTNGSVVIDSRFSTEPLLVGNGIGNIFRIGTVDTQAGLDAMNGLLASPEQYYLNIHSTDNPGGAMRVQLAPNDGAAPAISAVISGVDSTTSTTVAPGGLASIFGSSLGRVSTDLGLTSSMPSYPKILNGVSATVAGSDAAVLLVSPGEIGIQVPWEAPVGAQPLVIKNPYGTSAPFNIQVATTAPGLFFDACCAIAFKADNSLVRVNNPIRPGEIITLLATGLGGIHPVPLTGQDPAAKNTVDAAIAVTIGSQTAPLIQAMAVPGSLGLYSVTVVVPAAVSGASLPVILNANSASSNTATLPGVPRP